MGTEEIWISREDWKRRAEAAEAESIRYYDRTVDLVREVTEIRAERDAAREALEEAAKAFEGDGLWVGADIAANIRALASAATEEKP